jgi:N-acetyl-beta-hexosaminidase
MYISKVHPNLLSGTHRRNHNMKQKYFVIERDGKLFNGTLNNIITKLMNLSWDETTEKETYMKRVQNRVRQLHGTTIRIDTLENFFNDLEDVNEIVIFEEHKK